MFSSRVKRFLKLIAHIFRGFAESIIFAFFILGILENFKVINTNAILYIMILLMITITNMVLYLKFDEFKQISNKIVPFVAAIGLLVLAIKVYIPKFTVDYIRDAAVSAEAKGIEANDWLAYFGSIYGALIGSVVSVLGAVGVTLILNKIQQSKTNREQIQLAEAIVDEFLIEDINYNFQEIKEHYNSSFKRLKKNYNEFKNDTSYITMAFKFKNFNEVKHELIKYKSPIIIETLEKYKLFRLLEKLIPNETDLNTYNKINELMKKYYPNY